MQKLVVSGLLAGVAALCAQAPARAEVWDFSFVGIEDPTDVHGSGTLTTTGSSSPYTVTGATGTIYDTEAASPFIINGLSSYAGADNLFFYPPSPGDWYNSYGGISFTSTVGEAFNLGGGGTDAPQQNILNSQGLNPGGFPQIGNGSWNINLTVTAVPEPSTWAMLCLGLAALGVGGYRKVRKPRSFVA